MLRVVVHGVARGLCFDGTSTPSHRRRIGCLFGSPHMVCWERAGEVASHRKRSQTSAWTHFYGRILGTSL